MRDQMRIQVIAPIKFLVAKGTAGQSYGGVEAWDSFSFEGTEVAVGGTVAS